MAAYWPSGQQLFLAAEMYPYTWGVCAHTPPCLGPPVGFVACTERTEWPYLCSCLTVSASGVWFCYILLIFEVHPGEKGGVVLFTAAAVIRQNTVCACLTF